MPPFFTEPPVPHLDFSILPSFSRSVDWPRNPVIRVTALPARCFRSSCTRRSCCLGGGVVAFSETLSASNWNPGSVEYTITPDFFFFILLSFQDRKSTRLNSSQ